MGVRFSPIFVDQHPGVWLKTMESVSQCIRVEYCNTAIRT